MAKKNILSDKSIKKEIDDYLSVYGRTYLVIIIILSLITFIAAFIGIIFGSAMPFLIFGGFEAIVIAVICIDRHKYKNKEISVIKGQITKIREELSLRRKFVNYVTYVTALYFKCEYGQNIRYEITAHHSFILDIAEEGDMYYLVFFGKNKNKPMAIYPCSMYLYDKDTDDGDYSFSVDENEY